MNRHVRFRTSLLMVGLLTAGGCSRLRGTRSEARTAAPPVAETVSQPRLFEGMGNHTRTVSTSSPMAQKYFDQAFVWTFAFNHDEAIRSYKEAARLDPQCAMAWWGIALCNGPHINNPAMSPEQSKAAWEALQKAKALASGASATERQLIDALSKRYADPPPTDRAALDRAYADAMGEVWKANRNDADIGTLYAESLMDLRPWDLWTKDGKPQPGTEQIVATLDEVVKLNPNHPGVNHLYIHAVEASANPDQATPAANRLRRAVPASGHLVHMPSHIDVLTGRWKLAAEQNVEAIKIDRAYRQMSPNQGFYRFYMVHNHQMLSFAAMMEGRSGEAIQAARDVVQSVPTDYAVKNAALIDGNMGVVYDSLKRFGKWDELLREPPPPAYFPITNAVWHEARATAFAAKGKVAEAEKERLKFKERVASLPPDAKFAINNAHDVLAVAEHYLNGEIAYRKGNIDEAISELKTAVELEDKLRYMEPPEWIQPSRHTLGAILVDAGRYDEAEKVYRDDLKRWPENGWSLYGLTKCLRARGATAEADAVEKRFKQTWSGADVQIGSSCMCVKG